MLLHEASTSIESTWFSKTTCPQTMTPIFTVLGVLGVLDELDVVF
jgi:hypothetical protein